MVCVCEGGGEDREGGEGGGKMLAEDQKVVHLLYTFWQVLSKVDNCVQKFTTATGVITLIHCRTHTHTIDVVNVCSVS